MISNYEAELSFAKQTAYEAGKIMLHYFNAEQKGLTFKEDQSPVTLADTQINILVIESVVSVYPDHGVLGEEQGHELNRNKLWIVDPLDGTGPFSRGVPISVFSMAYAEDGVVKAAVVYDPFTDRLYSAAEGQGAYENDRKLDLHAHQPAETLSVLLEVSGKAWSTFEDPDIGGAMLNAFARAEDTSTYYLPIASSLALVAAGRFDAIVTSGKNPWDLAAGAFIAQEAGAIVTDIFGNPIYLWDREVSGVCAAKPDVHARMIEVINPVMKTSSLYL